MASEVFQEQFQIGVNPRDSLQIEKLASIELVNVDVKRVPDSLWVTDFDLDTSHQIFPLPANQVVGLNGVVVGESNEPQASRARLLKQDLWMQPRRLDNIV
jgi:hypothetical protein